MHERVRAGKRGGRLLYFETNESRGATRAAWKKELSWRIGMSKATQSGVPQLDETLEVLLLQTIEEAQQRMDDGEDVVPFTALLVGESVFEETHTGTTDELLRSSTQSAIEGAEGARAYAFCYDGYVETDDGDKDAIIAEGGMAGGGPRALP